jgi:hypothetical protein
MATVIQEKFDPLAIPAKCSAHLHQLDLRLAASANRATIFSLTFAAISAVRSRNVR